MAARRLSAELVEPNIEAALTAVLNDLIAVKTAYALLTAKLDADAGVTDTNYTALCTPAAATIVP